MEVFFSPIKIDNNNNNEENIKFKSYQNFAFIKFYDLNILCDCPLICKNDLNYNINQELFRDLDLDKLHEDTLFPATFLFNECINNIKENEKIEVDLILISNPYGLIGIPFLLHYNNYCNYLESLDSHSNNNNNQNNINNNYNQDDIDYHSDDSYSDEENFKQNYLNIYQWLNKYPSKFDITNSKLLITPPVYQSAILSLQQLIEYYSNNSFNNIIDPFLWLKTPDLFNIISSKLINNNVNVDDNNNNSLKIRHEIFSNLAENGPEYYYNQFSFNNDNENINNFNRKNDFKNTNNELINSRGSTTGLGAAINAASHIFDGNILQN
ncbi:Integrator complex subunit 9-like protein, partial [Cryptosporidium tyzzeri]